MTRINYFVATIRPQYEAILGSRAKAIEINNFFDLALPLGGIISIPFIGVFLDHTSTSAVLTALVTVSTAIGVFGIIPEMWAAYANVCLFVLYRPFYYTAVSDYSAKVFGFRTFGTVYGKREREREMERTPEPFSADLLANFCRLFAPSSRHHHLPVRAVQLLPVRVGLSLPQDVPRRSRPRRRDAALDRTRHRPGAGLVCGFPNENHKAQAPGEGGPERIPLRNGWLCFLLLFLAPSDWMQAWHALWHLLVCTLASVPLFTESTQARSKERY